MGLPIKDPSWMVKATLALVAAGGFAAYGLHGTGTPAPDLGPESLEYPDKIENEDAPFRRMMHGVPVLPGSTGIDPLLLVVNGSKANVIRAFSSLSPQEIIHEYERIARRQGGREVNVAGPSSPESRAPFSEGFGANLPLLLSRGVPNLPEPTRVEDPQIRAITWLDQKGRRITVHAPSPEGKGTFYFLTLLENPNALFGTLDGRDNPGEDVSGIPRPPNSVRILSITGQSVGAVATAIYRTPGRMENVHAYYESAMPRQGWDSVSLPDPGKTIIHRSGAQFFRQQKALCCVFVDQVEDHTVQTTVALFETP